jgi:hypothetical protein
VIRLDDSQIVEEFDMQSEQEGMIVVVVVVVVVIFGLDCS